MVEPISEAESRKRANNRLFASIVSRIERLEQLSMRLSDIENTFREAARDVDEIRRALEIDGEENVITRMQRRLDQIPRDPHAWEEKKLQEIMSRPSRRTLWQRLWSWMR